MHGIWIHTHIWKMCNTTQNILAAVRVTPAVLLLTVKFIMCAWKCGFTKLSWPPYIQLSNQEQQLNFQSHHSDHLLLQLTIIYVIQKYNIRMPSLSIATVQAFVCCLGSFTLTLSACWGHRVMSPYFLSQEGQRVRPILSSRRVHMHCVFNCRSAVTTVLVFGFCRWAYKHLGQMLQRKEG